MICYCDCECKGCEHSHGGALGIEEGRDAHHARLLLALDRSIAAACRSRGVDACDGLDDARPCTIGTLHTRAGELAAAIARVLDDPDGPSTWSRDHFDAAHSALEVLLLDFHAAVTGRPRTS